MRTSMLNLNGIRLWMRNQCGVIHEICDWCVVICAQFLMYDQDVLRKLWNSLLDVAKPAHAHLLGDGIVLFNYDCFSELEVDDGQLYVPESTDDSGLLVFRVLTICQRAIVNATKK
jgi:hypothetical protein